MSTLRVLAAMVGKDLRRRLREPLSTVLLLAFPLLFAGIMAMTFGTGRASVPKVHLLIDDQDGALLGRLLTSAFSQGDAAKYFTVEPVEGDALQDLERKEASAVLRLPKGLTDAVIAGKPATIELIRNPAQSILPEVAEQVTRILGDGLSAASYVLRQPLDELRPFLAGETDKKPSDDAVSRIAVAFNRSVTGFSDYVMPPVITLASGDAGSQPAAATGGAQPAKPAPASGTPTAASLFLLILPGISVFGLFMLTDQSMRDLLTEARLKTLRRQLAGPVSAGTVILGKALGTAAVAALGIAILSAIGWLVAPPRASLMAFLVLALALVVAATGFAGAVYGLSRGERQGSTLAALLTMLMAFSGGSFIPLDNLPAALKAVSPYSLIYWATRGFQRVLGDGAGLAEVLPNVAVLAGSGTVLLAVAAVLWRRRLLQGDLA